MSTLVCFFINNFFLKKIYKQIIGMLKQWQLTISIYLIRFLYWILQTETNKNPVPGVCVAKVKKTYNIEKNTTRDVIDYCLRSHKPLFWGFLDNQFHIDMEIFDGMMDQTDFLYLAMMLEFYGEAQTSLKFNDDISFENGVWSKPGSEAQTIPRRKITSNNISQLLKTCPYELNTYHFELEPNPEKITTTKQIPITKRVDVLEKLKRIWQNAMFKSFFGMVQTKNNDFILYSDEFLGVIKKPVNFANLPIMKLKAAIIMCNDDTEKKQMILDVLSMLDDNTTILIITKFNLDVSPNVACVFREDLLKTDLESSYDIIIIDDGTEFNLRSAYATSLFQINCRYKLVLYGQDNISNYLRLCGIVDLKTHVPQIGCLGFIQHNVIRVEPFISTVIIYKLDDELEPLNNHLPICFFRSPKKRKISL